MSVLTQAVYDRMVSDGTLVGLLASYKGGPAVFTQDPAPGDAARPFVVTAGEVAQGPFDTKTTRGRRPFRDIRCYADADGDVMTIEAIAERVRALFHRYELPVDGFGVLVATARGPVTADEKDVYGRVVTVEYILVEV